MKRILAVVAVVMFSSSAFAHVPNNCVKYFTQYESSSQLSLELAEQIGEAIKERGRIIKQYGRESEKWRNAEIRTINLNASHKNRLLDEQQILVNMILCINGHKKYQ